MENTRYNEIHLMSLAAADSMAGPKEETAPLPSHATFADFGRYVSETMTAEWVEKMEKS